METLVCCRQDREWLGRANVEAIPNGAVIPRPAAACVAVLGDPASRRRLAAGGRRLVEERYSWNSLEDRPKTASRDVSEKRHTA
jgi:hypothetical protein